MSERIRMGVALSEVGRDTARQRPRAPAGGHARARASTPVHGTPIGPTMSGLDAFCRALADSTKLPIVPYAAPRYDRLLHRLRAGEVELGWLAPVVALEALRQGIVPVALPLRGQSPWFWTALFVREDSPIESLRDLPGRRAVWVDRESASGYLVMRAALRSDGIEVERLFCDEVFASSHDGVVRAVMSDPMAVGATYAHLDGDGGVERAGWGRERVRVLRTAGPIPSDVLAASSTLTPAQVERVRDALVAGESKPLITATANLFSARGFLPAERAHLAHLELLGRYLIRA
jgi:phosphonate transport system substrate-binding protein